MKTNQTKDSHVRWRIEISDLLTGELPQIEKLCRLVQSMPVPKATQRQGTISRKNDKYLIQVHYGQGHSHLYQYADGKLSTVSLDGGQPRVVSVEEPANYERTPRTTMGSSRA